LENSHKLEYSPSKNETIWIIPQGDQIVIFFGIHFEEVADRAIAKLILYELEDAKRQVKNAPSVSKMFDDKVPELLQKEFPNSQRANFKFGNGLISITLFKSHYTTTAENSATMLQGFRQYIQYHIHGSKTYLHGRIRKRVGFLQKKINQSRFEEETKKVYRSAKGKNIEVNFKEEEKTISIMKK